MSQLTRIEFLVDDRNVGAVQRELAKFKVLNMVSVPVVNAVAPAKPGGKVTAATGGSAAEMVADAILRSCDDGAKMTTTEIKLALKALGKSTLTTSQIVKKLITAKVIKRTKTRGQFLVIKKGK